MTEQSALHGHSASRDDWSVVGMMHVASTEAEAREQTRWGLRDFYAYRHAASPTELWKEGEEVSHEDIVDRVNSTGAGLIGTPEMAVEYLQLLLDKTGGFGTFLFTATGWADPQTTLRSYELFAREIMPRFDATCEARVASFELTKQRKPQLLARFFRGIEQAKKAYAAEEEERGSAAPLP